MSDHVEITQKNLHPDRKLVTPIDVFRGGEYSVGTVVSGGTVSGGGLNVYQVSSQVRVRILNIELYNREGGWVEIEFRDGHFGGSRVLGPWKLDSRTDRYISHEQTAGRYFTSSVHAVVISGWVAQPLSNGIWVNIGRVNEPVDYYE